MQSKTDSICAPTPAPPLVSSALSAATTASIDAAPADRRRTRRFACEGTAKVIVLGGALTFIGKLRDLSVAGCRVITEVVFTLERGTHVEVVMVVNHTSFRVAAGVRSNHKQCGVGLEFMNVSKRSAHLIHDLVAEIEAKQKREAAQESA